MRKLSRRQPINAAVAAMVAGFSGASFAQQLDEIIVTAERRETTLQQTPISIAAFTAESMEMKGIETLEDVAAFTPNLDIKGGRFGGNVTPTYQIRGLSGGGGAAGERASAMYIDGIFMPRTTGPYMNVLDIERIEVLRGPQGTLFGRNSTGGAIRVFTKQPGPDQEAYIKLSAGNFSRADISAMVNVPISDSVFFRVQGGSLSQDGYVTRGTQELGGAEDTIGRLQLGFEPNDDFRVTIGVSSVDSESDGNPQDIETFDMNPDLNFEGQRADWLSDFLEAAGQAPLSADNDARIVLDDFTLPGWCFVDDGDPDWDPACEQINESKYSQADINLRWQISETWSFSSITGVSDFESTGLTDSVLLNTRADPSNVESDVVYQELQLNASFGDRLELVTGVSYFQEDSTSYGALLERRGTSVYNATGGLPAGNTVALGSGPNGLFRTGDTVFAQDATSYGLFANLTWNITDRLGLTPGFRVSRDEKRITDTEFASNDFTPAPGTTSTTVTPEMEWDDTDGRLTIDYDITDNHMVYLTASKAFRAGAYNYAILDNVTGEAQMAAFASGATNPFVSPESVENAEIGMRTEWLDGRLRLNLTYFDMTYSDRQAAVQVADPNSPVGFRITLRNSGDVELDGFELEGEIAATENFMIDFSAGLLDSLVTDPCANNGDFLFPGPVEDSYSLGGRWLKPLQSGSDLAFSLTYGWTGKQQTHPGGTLVGPCINPVTGAVDPFPGFFFDSRYELPDYGLLNGRIRYSGRDGKWSMTLFGNNLTDETYSNYSSRAGGGFWDGVTMAGVGAPLRSLRGATRGRPREYGLTFQYNFGGGSAGPR